MGVAVNHGRVLLNLAYRAKQYTGQQQQQQQHQFAADAIQQFASAQDLAVLAHAEAEGGSTKAEAQADKLHIVLGLACAHAVSGRPDDGVGVLQEGLAQAQSQVVNFHSNLKCARVQ